jgi:hypothetical protein
VGYTDATGLQGMRSYTVSQLSSINVSQLSQCGMHLAMRRPADMLDQAI